VGTADCAHVDTHLGKVTLEGLDALANLFFASWVGPGGPSSPQHLGAVSIRDGSGQWIEAPAACVFSFSSGTGDLVLTSSGLRLEAPQQHALSP
jgi:hypothetical protein